MNGLTKARDHLQMKRERGKRYYDSTEEYIDRIASKSSWSGKPYKIQLRRRSRSRMPATGSRHSWRSTATSQIV